MCTSRLVVLFYQEIVSCCNNIQIIFAHHLAAFDANYYSYACNGYCDASEFILWKKWIICLLKCLFVETWIRAGQSLVMHLLLLLTQFRSTYFPAKCIIDVIGYDKTLAFLDIRAKSTNQLKSRSTSMSECSFFSFR